MSLTIKSRRKDIPTDFNFNITPIHRSMIVFTERGRGRGHGVCVCVCVCERERERERE